MSNLPPAIDFAKTEEEICSKWAEEGTFKKQDALSLERGDKVRLRGVRSGTSVLLDSHNYAL